MPDQRQYAGYSIKELPKVNTDDEGKVLAVVKGKWDKSGSQIELPVVSSDDNGKVLGVTEGAWNKMDAPTELPAVTSSDNGRILQVSNGEWTKQNMPTELPAVTAGDNGKFLGVANGNWGAINDSTFIIPVTWDSANNKYKTTVTNIDIRNALMNNKNVYVAVSEKMDGTMKSPNYYFLSRARAISDYAFGSTLTFINIDCNVDPGKSPKITYLKLSTGMQITISEAMELKLPTYDQLIIDVTGKRGGDNLSVEQGTFLEAINVGKTIYVKDDNASCGLVPLRSSGAGSRTNEMQYAFISDPYVPSDEFEDGVWTPKFQCYILDIRDTTAEPFTYVQLTHVHEYSTL